MNPWKVILATVIIFATGVITGALVVNRVQRPERPQPLVQRPRPQNDFMPNPWFVRREFLQRMDHHLDLSREQYDRIAKILQDSQERTRVIVGRVGPEIQEELRHVRREIRTQLNPDQSKKFEELQHLLMRPGRPPGHNTEMRPGPRREPPPLNARPNTNPP